MIDDDRDDGGYCDDHYYDEPYCRHRPRPPRDGSFVIVNDTETGGTAEYIYDGYTNRWVSIHDLSLNVYQQVTDSTGAVVEIIQPSIAPLSMRDQNGLAALLAAKLCDFYGMSPTQMIVHDGETWQQELSTGFGEPEGETHNEIAGFFRHHHRC